MLIIANANFTPWVFSEAITKPIAFQASFRAWELILDHQSVMCYPRPGPPPSVRSHLHFVYCTLQTNTCYVLGAWAVCKAYKRIGKLDGNEMLLDRWFLEDASKCGME